MHHQVQLVLNNGKEGRLEHRIARWKRGTTIFLVFQSVRPQKISRNLTVSQLFCVFNFNLLVLINDFQGDSPSSIIQTKIRTIHWRKNDLKKSPSPTKPYPMMHCDANIMSLVPKKPHLKEDMSILRKSLALYSVGNDLSLSLGTSVWRGI